MAGKYFFTPPTPSLFADDVHAGLNCSSEVLRDDQIGRFYQPANYRVNSIVRVNDFDGRGVRPPLGAALSLRLAPGVLVAASIRSRLWPGRPHSNPMAGKRFIRVAGRIVLKNC